MSEGSSNVIYMVVGSIIALLVAGLAFFIFRTVSVTGKEVTTQVVGKMTAVLESQYTQYDGETTSGQEILNLINDTYSASTPLYVTVKTNSDTTGKTYCYTTALAKIAAASESTLIANAKDKTKNEFIAPTGVFGGAVVRNANNEIIGLEFTQK